MCESVSPPQTPLPVGLEQKEAASGNKTLSYWRHWHPGHGDRPWLALEPSPRWLGDRQGTEWVVSCTTAPALFMKENPARAGREGRRKSELLITAIVPSPLHRPAGMAGLEITQPCGGEAGGGWEKGLGQQPSDSWAHPRAGRVRAGAGGCWQSRRAHSSPRGLAHPPRHTETLCVWDRGDGEP